MTGAMLSTFYEVIKLEFQKAKLLQEMKQGGKHA
jgi:hypothetical protein